MVIMCHNAIHLHIGIAICVCVLLCVNFLSIV